MCIKELALHTDEYLKGQRICASDKNIHETKQVAIRVSVISIIVNILLSLFKLAAGIFIRLQMFSVRLLL